MAKKIKGPQQVPNDSREMLSKNPYTKVSEVVAQACPAEDHVQPESGLHGQNQRKTKSKQGEAKIVLEATKTAGFINPVQLIVEVRALAQRKLAGCDT